MATWILSTFNIKADCSYLGKDESHKKLRNFLLLEANAIGKECRRGNANVVVVSPMTSALLQDDNAFVIAEQTNSIGSVALLKIGTIGNVVVFTDYSGKMLDDEILLIRATKQNEPGVHFLVQAVTTEIIESQDEEIVQVLSTFAVHSTAGSDKMVSLKKFQLKNKPLPLRILEFLKII